MGDSLSIALQHHQAGRLQEAETIYRQILQAQPDHPDALHLLGVVAHQRGQHDVAIRYIQQAIDHNPRDAKFHNNIGEAYRAQGLLEEAEAHYKQALALRPEYAEAHNNLGNALKAKGRLTEAAAHYQKALAFRPEYADAAYNLGVVNQQQGQWAEAAVNYQRALALQPPFAELYNNLGAALAEQGLWTEAIAHYRQALALRSDYAEAHHNLANALNAHGQWDEAEVAYRQALRLKPDCDKAHYCLAAVCHRQGKLEEAIRHYRQALILDPTRARAWHSLGLAYQSYANLEEAVAAYRQALTLNPMLSEAFIGLGIANHARGELGEAVTAYQQALALQPDHVETLNNLGAALHEQGRLEQAVKQYRHALKCKPDYAPAFNNLGNVFKAQGNLREALAHYRQAIELQPDLAQAHTNLGNVLKDQGQPEQAVVAYRHAVALRPSDGLRILIATALPAIPNSKDHLLNARRRFEAEVEALLTQDLSINNPIQEVGSTNFYLAYHGLNDLAIQQAVSRLYERACPSLSYTAPRCLVPGCSRTAGKIRVGFVSRFLYNHSVGITTGGLLANLSREQFCVYSLLVAPVANDQLSNFFQEKADKTVVLPSNLKAARDAISAEELDILFYPDIGMEPLTYFLAFSRLAPVQCVFPGHPVTTGIRTIDYFISSTCLEPEDAETHYSERLIRLKHLPVYYYRPAHPDPSKSREDFGLNDGTTIYLCPQALFKFHPDFDELLAGILRADPRGQVAICEAPEEQWTRLLMHRFKTTIPDVVKRIHFLQRQNTEDFLRLLSLADVILDTLHFNGGTTSYMALAMGTPIVTLPGDFMRGRVTYACYKQMGMMECVASSKEEYVELAVRLGNDREFRERVRTEILSRNHLLFEDIEAVRELECFFVNALQDLRHA